MRSFNFVLALVLTAIMSGCYSVSARYSFDSETDFSALTSYAWESVDYDIFSTAASAEHYKKSMDDLLAKKGFSLNPENPDFLIVTARVETYIEKYRTLNGNVQFPKAMLRVDFISSSSSTILYEGAVDAYFEASATQKVKNSTIDKGVEALLLEFPPGG
jgi:hypothetical protein